MKKKVKLSSLIRGMFTFENELLDYELMDHGSKLTRDKVVHIETVANLCGTPVSSKNRFFLFVSWEV